MRKNKKVVVSAAAVTMSVLLGACGGSTSSQATSTEVASEAETEAAESADSDQEAADKVAKLIDDIYVQERTDDTDEQCKAAKEAWDALTDEQKELVEGENADPDYFGRDTGDASLDDPRNQDEIGDKEILVVSFGTSFNDSRVKDIKSIEDSIQEAFPDWAVRRAFTAQIIINHVEARDGECIAGDAFELLAKDLEETVKKGETTTPFPEKYRVMFEGIPCWPKLPALFKPLKTHGVNVTAVVYAPAFGFVYNNIDEMARAYYKAPNSVCIEQGVDWREGICRDNKVDGVLVHYNRSCKPWSGYMAEMQRRFTADLGIPCAGFDGDQADPRNFNAAQYETRVEGLVEAMEANKQAKEAK